MEKATTTTTSVMFTRGQTADEYIESSPMTIKKYDIVVATSDAPARVISEVPVRTAFRQRLRKRSKPLRAGDENYLGLQRIRRSSAQDSLATDIKSG